MSEPFPPIRFKGRLRPSQVDVVEIARRQLGRGERKLHVVAPPGSGKTVLGLYLWAECIRVPALVLSPNSAIQAQWAARLDLFDGVGRTPGVVSTDPDAPALFTSLTYQAVTIPRRGGDDMNADAIEIWIEKLIERGQAEDPHEAEVWIDDLKRHNRAYYEDRLSGYRKEVRDRIALRGEAMKTLHDSALETLERLRQTGVGLLILDECHHLMSHWGRVLADVHRYFDHPIVVGLTATPPEMDGRPPQDIQRYRHFFGPVDYEVPVPAVVKDGFLAPYQDLVQFVRPTAEELAYVANADKQLLQLIDDLCEERQPAEQESQPPTDSTEMTGDDGSNLAPREHTQGGNPNVAPREHTRGGNPNLAPCEYTRGNEPVGEKSAIGVPAEAGHPKSEIANENATVSQTDTTHGPPENDPSQAGPLRCEESLNAWLSRALRERRLAVGTARDWAAFASRDAALAYAGPLFLQSRGLPLPKGVPKPASMPFAAKSHKRGATRAVGDMPPMAVLVPVLDRYIRHRLRVSADPADHALAETAIRRLRMLGTQITETGSRACASPIGRVMAYAKGKTEAVLPILKAERDALGERIRAVVVTDYEKTSAVTAEISHLLDEEAGGAIAAFRTLLSDPETDALDPVLVTGSTVLVDDDLAPVFDSAAAAWLAKRRLDVQLDFGAEEGFHVLSAHGGDWCPRVYVAMVTELFQSGVTKCLVGTRGLLGEGWDASKINVLIDLTTVTTSTSVNQLRGRSLRLDSEDPRKLAHNWDVVCVAPEFVKGLDDYDRFIAKHNTLFGLTDDGVIEKGVGHVHAAFTEIEPELVEESMNVLNAEMLERPRRRAEFRALWKIGEPFHPEPVHAVELAPEEHVSAAGFPPWSHAQAAWTTQSLTLAISRAVLGALHEARLIGRAGEVHVERRAGGYVRAFLEDADEDEGRLFSDSLQEALGPLDRPRYVIRRFVDNRIDTWLSRILPTVVGRYFQRSRRRMEMLHAVPAALARNKRLAMIYGRHWNAHVSPGQPVYARSEKGERLVALAQREGTTPDAQMHRKEVFL